MHCIKANCCLRKRSSHGQQYYRLSHSEINISSLRGISVIPWSYLSMIMFLILAAALMELCQNLFSSVSWFSLNTRGIHLPSPPVIIPGSWRAPSQHCASTLLQCPWLWWRHQWLSHLHVHGMLSQDESLCSPISAFAKRPDPTRRTWVPTFTQGPVPHTAPT